MINIKGNFVPECDVSFNLKVQCSDWIDKRNKQMWSKTVAKLREIEDIVLEEMEAWLITAVKEIACCLMSVWRKLAYDLAEDMHTPIDPNNRNMSAVKMAYQFNVRCDLCLWNAESKIVAENCLLVLRTAFSLEGSDVLKKNWRSYTQTHINTDTCRHINTQTHKHPCTHANKHVHTQPYTEPQHRHKHTHSRIP